MRRLLMFVVLLLAASVANASSLFSAVQQLDADCAARIAAIGTPPATKKLKLEAKGLAKVRTQLAKYDGGNSVADLRNIAKAGPLLLASGTKDPAIAADVSAILDCLQQMVDQRFANAQDVLDDLLDPVNRNFIKQQMQLAKSYYDKGKAALPENPSLAALWFLKAYNLYGYNQKRAEDLLEKEQGNPPPDGIAAMTSQTEFLLQNFGPDEHRVAKIRVFAELSDGLTVVKTYTGQTAKALVPTFLAVKGSNVLAVSSALDLKETLFVPLATADGAPGGRNPGVRWKTQKDQNIFVVAFDITLS
jgi:hypothetical protein